MIYFNFIWCYYRTDSELNKKINQDNKNNGTNDMDDIIIKNEKLTDEESSRVGIEKDEPLDSEEETGWRVVHNKR